MTNRLAGESSPYLLQHKDNPVDWYPWSEEALAAARRDDKPILLSIGYAACHWCHVMERESFEDTEIADLMNQHFVNIKVDREERPDLDAVYMEAVQAMTGQGGWPMTVFLTPDGHPFFGGTYWPPNDRHGMPSFRKVLTAIADTWSTRRAEALEQGARLTEHISSSVRLAPTTDPIGEDLLAKSYEALSRAFDPTYGGFGGAPKFPQPMTIDLLLRLAHRGYDDALGMARRTLDAMAAGGMFDQLGGGFARYSVDRMWLVPHFEKMLYDNAQLLRTYARAWLITRTPRFEEVARATANWMLTEMRDRSGGFWSSLDADSEGEEGKFYVWSLDEVMDATGPDADNAIAHWGFTAEGNFEGKNIPVYAQPAADAASIERGRRALLERRAERVRPATDTKVLTAWNALAASSLAEAGTILNEPEWVTAAQVTMDFILDEMRSDGRLLRSYRDGLAKQPAFAEDYAAVLEASLALLEATFEPRWLSAARWAADEARRLFLDDQLGGFFTVGTDAEELITRSKDLVDNAVPAANSVLAVELQRLATITGDPSYEQMGLDVLRLLGDNIARSPLGFGHLLGAVDYYTGAPAEIVVVGDPEGKDTRELLGEVRSRFIPNKVVLVATEGADATALSPLFEGKRLLPSGPDGGRATVYVCTRGVCKRPVNTRADLAAELAHR